MAVPILNKQVIYPKEETLIYPMIDRNDQRKDIATPLLGIVDWAQCKGNSFQNILNFIGLSSSDSKIKTELSTMSTYAYYSGFESYILFNKLKSLPLESAIAKAKKEGHVYDWNLHIEFCNILLKTTGFKLERKSANVTEIIDYIVKNKYPVILGTFLSRKHGHIITVIGVNDKGLICSDPYGIYPYGKESAKNGHNGFKVLYDTNLIQEVVSPACTSVYLREL